MSSLLISLMLATVVWFVSVSEINPFEDAPLPGVVEVDLGAPPPDLIIVSPPSAQVALTVRGPRSVVESLSASQVRVFIDLSGYDAGVYDVPLQWEFLRTATGVRVTNIAPARTVQVALERRATREIRVRVQKDGEPSAGYDVGDERLAFTSASITGPASAVERVSELIAGVSLASLKSIFNQAVPLVAIDADGRRIDAVTISPASVQVQVPITQKEGFRDVAVKFVYRGVPAPGYRLTNYIVTPLIVTVSSSDRDQVSALPGFVETEPFDISGASENITQELALVLPEGIFPVGEPTVLVQISIEPIIDTVSVQRPVEVQNLGPGLIPTVLPDTVEVLVTGPVPVLRT
ncbi:MAG: CdaR family protein, partial [Anaerolineales bacterium]